MTMCLGLHWSCDWRYYGNVSWVAMAMCLGLLQPCAWASTGVVSGVARIIFLWSR